LLKYNVGCLESLERRLDSSGCGRLERGMMDGGDREKLNTPDGFETVDTGRMVYSVPK
jgi:hypothetical protein